MEKSNERELGKILEIRVWPHQTAFIYENGNVVKPTFELFENNYSKKEFLNDPTLGTKYQLTKYENAVGTIYGSYAISSGAEEENEHDIYYYVDHKVDANIANLLGTAGQLSHSEGINKQVYELLEAYNREEIEGDRELLQKTLTFKLGQINDISYKDININVKNLGRKEFETIRENITESANKCKEAKIASEFSSVPKFKKRGINRNFKAV